MKVRRVIIYFLLVISFFFYNFYFRPVSGNPLITKEFKSSSSYINGLYKSDEYFKKNVLQEEEYYLYEKIIDDIQSGKSKSSIPCDNSCGSSWLSSVITIYLDHPELINYQQARSRLKGDVLEIHYESLGKVQTYFGVRRIEREISIIQKETKNMSEKEKIIFVYNYVASHNYDRFFTDMSSNQSAYSFFTKGTSVCAGFAKASQIIFQNIGIQSLLVEDGEHMWNYVEYEGKYYIFDATYGTSFYNKEHPNYYDGLGKTTTGNIKGYYPELYPSIEDTPLKELFGL